MKQILSDMEVGKGKVVPFPPHPGLPGEPAKIPTQFRSTNMFSAPITCQASRTQQRSLCSLYPCSPNP